MVVGAAARTARATTEAGPVPVATTWPGGSAASSASSIARVSGATRLVELGVEGVAGLAGVVAGADEEGQPFGVEPGAGEPCPAIGRRLVAPRVEGLRRCPGRVAVGVRPGGEEPGRGGDLDHQRGRRLVELGELRGRLRGRAPRGRRCGAPPAGGRPSGRPRARRAVRPRRRRPRRRGRPAWRPARRWRSRAVRRSARAWCVRRAARSAPRPGRGPAAADPARAARARAAPRLGSRPRPGEIARRAEPASASPEPASTCSSIARAAGDSWASRVVTSACERPGVIGCSTDSDPSASGTPVRGRSPASLSQTRARSVSRRTALSTAGGSASRMWASSASVVWPDATRASRTESSRRVSRSRARFSDDRVAAREASWPLSAGAGVDRSGRSRSNPVSRSSGQLRSWSASERCPLLVTGPGADEVAIVPTLAVDTSTGSVR